MHKTSFVHFLIRYRVLSFRKSLPRCTKQVLCTSLFAIEHFLSESLCRCAQNKFCALPYSLSSTFFQKVSAAVHKTSFVHFLIRYRALSFRKSLPLCTKQVLCTSLFAIEHFLSESLCRCAQNKFCALPIQISTYLPKYIYSIRKYCFLKAIKLSSISYFLIIEMHFL